MMRKLCKEAQGMLLDMKRRNDFFKRVGFKLWSRFILEEQKTEVENSARTDQQ